MARLSFQVARHWVRTERNLDIWHTGCTTGKKGHRCLGYHGSRWLSSEYLGAVNSH